MNDRNLAIQVSKHPLIKKLLETKIATTSVVARLIVEEMMYEQEGENFQVVSKKYYDALEAMKKEISTMPKAITKKQYEDYFQEHLPLLNDFKEVIQNSRELDTARKTAETEGAGRMFDNHEQAPLSMLKNRILEDNPDISDHRVERKIKGLGLGKNLFPFILIKAKELGALKELDNKYLVVVNKLKDLFDQINNDDKNRFGKSDQPTVQQELRDTFDNEGNKGPLQNTFYNYDEIKAALGAPKQKEKTPQQQPELPEIPEQNKEKYEATQLYKTLETDEQKQAILYFLYFYDNTTIAEEEAKGPYDKLEPAIQQRIAKAITKVEGVNVDMVRTVRAILKANPQLVVDTIKEFTAEPEEEEETADTDNDGVPDADEKQTPEEIFKTGFDEEEQKILTKYRDFVREKQPITESAAIGVATAMRVNKEITREFMNTLHNTPELPILQRAFGKVMNDQNLLKGVNWLFDQDQPEQQDDTGEEAEEEPEEEEKVEDFQVSENTLAALKGSVEEFITEFYEVPFLTDQAKLVKAIMNALAEVKKELEKEPEQQARMKGQGRRQQNEQEEPAPASEDLLKNIRVDLRAFLKLTKKTKVALKTFKSNAEKGSFMTDSSKEEFMKLIARLQMTIAEIVGELKKMSPINEQEQQPQEEKEDWEKAQDFYNDAANALDGLVGVLDDGGTKGEPIELIDTASKNLFSLTQFFPSVNPFSAGKKDLGDITEYDAEFDEAVKEVKSHVQSILSLVKERVGGQTTIRETIVGLEEFSGKIQNIFGTESNLEGVKVSPGDDALEGETTDIKQMPDPRTAERVLNLPEPDELTVEEKKLLSGVDLEEAPEQILNTVAQVAVGPSSVQNLAPEEKEEAENQAVEFVQAVQQEPDPATTTPESPEEDLDGDSYLLKTNFKEWLGKALDLEGDSELTDGEVRVLKKMYLYLQNPPKKKEKNEDLSADVANSLQRKNDIIIKGFVTLLSKEERRSLTAAMKKITTSEKQEEFKNFMEQSPAAHAEANYTSPNKEEEEEEELSLEEKVNFLNKMREEIVLRPEDEEENYQITDIEAGPFGTIDIKYKDDSKKDLLSVSEDSIEELYKLYKAQDFNALINISDKNGKVLPFLFKLIKPYGSFDEETGDSLNERIEKLIKPLIKEMLTKGK